MEFIAAALSIIGGIKGKKGAEKAAMEQAKMEGLLTNAKLEDLKTQERVMKGQTIAAVAGSNVKTDIGSPLQVLMEQAKNFTKERQTVAQVGATRSGNTLLRGKQVGRQALWQGWTNAFAQTSSAFSTFSQVMPERPEKK